jgi:hypothetical protein
VEFEIPEPGAWTRWLLYKNTDRDLINKLPLPLTKDGKAVSTTNKIIQANDLSDDPIDDYYYGKIVARYGAQGVSPPPGPQTIAASISFPGQGTPPTQGTQYLFVANTNAGLPGGYFASSWEASVLTKDGGISGITGFEVDISVGAGTPVISNSNPQDQVSGSVGPISIDTVPIAVAGFNVMGLEVNVEIKCEPLAQTVQQWQNDTYDLIVAAYYAML